MHIFNPIFEETDGKYIQTPKFYKWLIKEKHGYRAILDTIDIVVAAGKLRHMESHYEQVKIR